MFVKVVIIIFCVLLVLTLMLPSLSSILGKGQKNQQQAQQQTSEQKLPTVDELNASYQASIKSLDERLQSDPQNTTLLTNIADAYYTWGQQVMALNQINGQPETDDTVKNAFTQAVSYYDKVIALTPSNTVSANRALSLYYAGDKEQGMKDMETLAQSATDYPMAYVNLGMMQQESGDVNAALQSYDKALSQGGDAQDQIKGLVAVRVNALVQSGKVSQDALSDQMKQALTSLTS